MRLTQHKKEITEYKMLQLINRATYYLDKMEDPSIFGSENWYRIAIYNKSVSALPYLLEAARILKNQGTSPMVAELDKIKGRSFDEEAGLRLALKDVNKIEALNCPPPYRDNAGISEAIFDVKQELK